MGGKLSENRCSGNEGEDERIQEVNEADTKRSKAQGI